MHASFASFGKCHPIRSNISDIKLSPANSWFHKCDDARNGCPLQWNIATAPRVRVNATANIVENWRWPTVLLRMTIIKQITVSIHHIVNSNRYGNGVISIRGTQHRSPSNNANHNGYTSNYSRRPNSHQHTIVHVWSNVLFLESNHIAEWQTAISWFSVFVSQKNNPEKEREQEGEREEKY